MQIADNPKEEDPMEKLLTTLDVAKRLNKSPETIRVYERVGKLPAVKTQSGMRLFREADVVRFEREHNTQSPEPA